MFKQCINTRKLLNSVHTLETLCDRPQNSYCEKHILLLRGVWGTYLYSLLLSRCLMPPTLTGQLLRAQSMTTSDILSMSLVATSVREALVQQKQMKIAVEEVMLPCLAFTFFQKLIKTFSSPLDLHSVPIQSMYSNRVQDKWVGLLLHPWTERPNMWELG